MNVTKRQVHETKGSFYIYLPKEWILRNNINREKSLALIEYFDDSLILKNDPDIYKIEKEVVIPLYEIKDDKSLLKNYIIAAYIIGANKITIKSSDGIKAQTREEVSQQIRELPGFEIIVENENIIQSKEIGQILDINSIIQTLFSTTSIMFKAILELISNPHKDIESVKLELKAIIKRDDDIDRYRHMVDRQSHLILSDPYLISVQKLNPISTLHISQIASHIERIADHIVEIARYVRINIETLKKISENLTGLVQMGITNFSNLALIYQKGNYLEALEQYKIIHQVEKSIQKKLKNEEFEFGIYHLGRIFSYCVNIAEILINQTAYDVLYLRMDDKKNVIGTNFKE
jgi:phosphate uptake regulator